VRVAAHAHGGEGLTNAIEGGVDTIEHGIFLNDAQAARMAELGVVLVPTLANEMRYQESVAAGLVPAVAQRQRAHLEETGHPLPTPEARMAIARRHGVRVIVGTDAGGNAMVRHGDTPLELVMLQRCGFGALDALAAATGLAAPVVGVDGAGRIASGAKADLLITRSDPTRDVTVLAEPSCIAAVVKGGHVVRSDGILAPFATATPA
jgi:imidazolonepropionase-like amidohydrolase